MRFAIRAISNQGMKRLAVYADETDTPTHMARQLPSGHWTSKLGELEDIQHVRRRSTELPRLTGGVYDFSSEKFLPRQPVRDSS